MYLKPLAILLAFIFPLGIFAMQGGKSQVHSSLSFIENKGQITDQHQNPRSDIDFRVSAPGMNIFIGEGQVHYQWSKVNAAMRQCDNAAIPKLGSTSPLQGDLGVETYRLDVTLLGANKNAQLITEEQQEYYENYYLPQFPNGQTAHSYKKIIYKSIYPNIDWVLYVANSKFKSQNSKEGEGLKYDFIIHPGGNYKDIRIKYDGAASINLNNIPENNHLPLGEAGRGLLVTTPFGSITEHAPYTYDAVTKEQINSAFVLKDNILSFDINTLSSPLGRGRERAFIIDPQLEWATYYGDIGSEVAVKLSLDNAGYPYLLGTTSSINNIATTGSYQSTYISGSQNAFIAKFNDQGNAKIWATYYKGNRADHFTDLQIDVSNNLYIAGGTNSNLGISTPGTYQSNWYPGVGSYDSSDGFILKFDNSGQKKWGTYFGGEKADEINAIAADINGNIYAVGTTHSKNNITTIGCHQDTLFGPSDAFVAKFNSSGNLSWATYYGGRDSLIGTGISQGLDAGTAITCDLSGNVYVGGITGSFDHIATPGSHQPTNNSDSLFVNHSFWTRNVRNGFLVKFNSSGARQWGTYYGGSDYPNINAVKTDPAGNIYIAGRTASVDGIASTGSYKSELDTTYWPQQLTGSITDAFLAKFNSGGVRQWGTYFGGHLTDLFLDMVIDKAGDICLGGSTTSHTNIATAGAWKFNNSAGTDTTGPLSQDAMFVKFAPGGQRLWATYYGGGASDRFESVASDNAGNIYLYGYTNSDTAISTPLTYQPVFVAGTETFLVKALPDSIVYINQPFIDTVICINSAGGKLRFEYITSRSFRSSNIFTAQLSDSSGSFVNPLVIGSVASTASGYIYCTIPPTISFGKHYRIRVIATSPAYVSNDDGMDIEIRQGPETPTASGDTLLCTGQMLHLNATSPAPTATYSWLGPNNFSSTLQKIIIDSVQLFHAGRYIVYADPAICKIGDTIDLKVYPGVTKPEITVNSPLCEGDTIDFHFRADTGDVLYNWPWPNLHPIKFTDTGVIDIATKEMTGIYTVNAVRTGCTNADTAEIIVKLKPVLTASSNSPVKAGKELQLFVNADSANTSYYWTGPDSFSSALQNPVISFATGVKSGTYSVLGTHDGCTTSALVIVSVSDDRVFILFPNPNNGNFYVKGNLKRDQHVSMAVSNAAGQEIWNASTETNKKILDYHVTLPEVADGVYTFRLRADGNNIAIPFTVK
jgi:hypothetical protein